MSEETKRPESGGAADEEKRNTVPGEPEAAPEQAPEQTSEAGKKAAAEEPADEEKISKKDARQKEKTYTLTRDQMEAAELTARQLAAAKDQFLRLTAEYDNYRKRTAKEKDSLYQDAKADTIREFLAVYDNLERAMAGAISMSRYTLRPPGT